MPISSILKARRQKEKEALKKKILQVAKRIAIKEGWSSVTIRRIASEISYSLPVIYAHFKDKAEIIHLIAAEGYLKLEEVLNTASTEEEDKSNQLLDFCKAYFDFGIQNPAIYHAMYSENYLNGDSQPRNKIMEFFTNKIKPQTQKAKINLDLILANLHGLVNLAHTINKVSPLKTQSDEYLEFLVETYTPALS
jgi:AcrR family transcriptional regulator